MIYSEHRISAWVFVGVTLLGLAFMPPAPYSIDGNSPIAMAQSIVMDHDITVPAELGRVGRDGRVYSAFYLLLTLLAVPFVAVGIAMGNLAHIPPDYASKGGAMVLSSLIAAANAAMVVLLTVRLGGSRPTAVLAAVAYTFGTVSMAYTGDFFSDPLLGLVTVTALYYAFGERQRDATIAGILAMLAVVAKPFGIVVGPVLSLYMLLAKRPLLDVSKPGIGALLGYAVFLAYNAYRWGWFKTYPYPPLGLQYMPEALLGFVFSPGKGLFVFCPAVIAALACFRAALKSRKRLESLAIAAMSASYLLAYSTFPEWYSYWAWGPRYIIPALPCLLALMAFAGNRIRRLAIALTVLGLLVNAPVMLSYYDRYRLEAQESVSVQQLIWSPKHSSALQQWGSAYRTLQDAAQTDPTELTKHIGPTSNMLSGQQILHIVAVWWWMLPIVGIPWWLGLIICVGMVGAGVLALKHAFRLSSIGNAGGASTQSRHEAS